MLFTTLGIFFGIALGWRCNLLVLVPAIPLASLSVGISAAASGESAVTTTVAIISAVVGLQCGYIAGVLFQRPPVVRGTRRPDWSSVHNVASDPAL